MHSFVLSFASGRVLVGKSLTASIAFASGSNRLAVGTPFSGFSTDSISLSLNWALGRLLVSFPWRAFLTILGHGPGPMPLPANSNLHKACAELCIRSSPASRTSHKGCPRPPSHGKALVYGVNSGPFKSCSGSAFLDSPSFLVFRTVYRKRKCVKS